MSQDRISNIDGSAFQCLADFMSGHLTEYDALFGRTPDEVVMKNKIHPHKGHMWAIAAYTPTAFKRCSNENREFRSREVKSFSKLPMVREIPEGSATEE